MLASMRGADQTRCASNLKCLGERLGWAFRLVVGQTETDDTPASIFRSQMRQSGGLLRRSRAVGRHHKADANTRIGLRLPCPLQEHLEDGLCIR